MRAPGRARVRRPTAWRCMLRRAPSRMRRMSRADSAAVAAATLQRTFAVERRPVRSRKRDAAGASTASTSSRAPRATCWASSANPAAASRRSARMLLGLIAADRRRACCIDGQDIGALEPRARVARRVQPVFQDPYSSLNPRRSVAADRARCRSTCTASAPPAERRARGARDARARRPAARATPTRCPRELSGGQRQRVGDRARAGDEPGDRASATSRPRRSTSRCRRRS